MSRTQPLALREVGGGLDHVTRLNAGERSVTDLATEIIGLSGWS